MIITRDLKTTKQSDQTKQAIRFPELNSGKILQLKHERSELNITRKQIAL